MDAWRYRPAADLGLSPLGRLTSVRREAGTGEWLAQHAWWSLMRTYLAVAQRLKVKGRERLPASPPFVLVSNHTSHLDAVVLGALLRARDRGQAFPVGAGDTFFRTPAVAAFSALLLNALPLWRRACGSHALETLRARLVEERCVLILFPEGTRARDGRLGPFRAGLGRLVAGTAVPVVPCHVRGAFESWPAQRPAPRRGAIRVRVGAPLTFQGVPDAREGWDLVAAAAHAAVEALAAEDAAPRGGVSGSSRAP